MTETTITVNSHFYRGVYPDGTVVEHSHKGACTRERCSSRWDRFPAVDPVDEAIDSLREIDPEVWVRGAKLMAEMKEASSKQRDGEPYVKVIDGGDDDH